MSKEKTTVSKVVNEYKTKYVTAVAPPKIKEESSIKEGATKEAATEEVIRNGTVKPESIIKEVTIQDLKNLDINFEDEIEDKDDDVITFESYLGSEQSFKDIEPKKFLSYHSYSREIDRVSSYSRQSNASYLFQKEIDVGPDFFDILGEIPNVSEISSDLSRELSTVTIKSIKSGSVKVKVDSGSFVNPLTGELESELKEPVEVAEVVEEVEGESEYERWDEEDEDLLVLAEADHVVEVGNKLVEDKVFEAFREMENAAEEAAEPEIDYEARNQERGHRHLVVITTVFLAELIRIVVEECEFIDPSVTLRHNLDKMKLMTDIVSKADELKTAQKTCAFLNRKIVNYFKRRNKFRFIMEDNSDTVIRDTQRLKNATAKLDLMMGREEDLKSETIAKIANLNTEVNFKEEQVRNQIKDLENTIKSSLHQEMFDKLPQVVINLLSNIEHVRDEVSEVRLMLIKRQHTLATLMEKLTKLENLGEGLYMINFEHLQAETQALDKTIEERNSELNKCYLRFNAELHVMSHIKEEQKMLRSTVAIRKDALEDLQLDKQNKRQHLHNLKLDRGRIRNEIRELSFQGGLVDKPALMFDYDDTVDRLEMLQNTVNQYKKKYTDLKNKIRKLEGKLNEYGN